MTGPGAWDGTCLTCGGPTDGAAVLHYSHKHLADCIRYLGYCARYLEVLTRDLERQIADMEGRKLRRV